MADPVTPEPPEPPQPPVPPSSNLVPVNIQDEMRRSYVDYAMSVIIGRALPDIPGVDTTEQQVNIAARKAGIAPGTPLKLSRFRVDRFREK